jgi:integrase
MDPRATLNGTDVPRIGSRTQGSAYVAPRPKLGDMPFGAGVSMATKRRTPGAGAVRQLPSGRWQARFRGPDGIMRPAPVTFDTKLDAGAWLQGQAQDVERGTWAPAEGRPTSTTTLKDYSSTWLASRDLKPRTRLLYRNLLDAVILPDLGDARLDRISPTTVRNWYATLDESTPTRRAHAYSLLRAIYTTAVSDDLVPTNPCRIRGAGKAKKAHTTRIASLAELEVIVEALPTRYRPMALLAAWCSLRFGELAELRRDDVHLDSRTIRVERAVTSRDGQVFVGDPKSDAGKRTVSIPPHLLPVLEEHLRAQVGSGADALLFPAVRGGHLAPTTFHTPWSNAREKAKRPDLRFHDLRHTGATLAAATGATLAELMTRLGHSTPQAAMVYQHAAADRDRAIAEALSGFASAKVVPLRSVGRGA